jgi:peptidoglycan-associated lipoprotein
MKNFFALALLVPFVLGGCGKTNKKEKKNKRSDDKSMSIPLASADAKSSFFDEEVEAFVLEDELKNGSQAVAKNDEVSWVAETDAKGFKPIYFDFDRYGVRADQQEQVESDVKQAKKIVAKGEKVVVEGHACHSAGSKSYNLLISEQRAQEIARRLESEGIAANRVTVVGRGTEMPVILGGDKNAQAPNRRVELFPLAS